MNILAFPENFINELVERNDIVDVVKDYVQLGKRSGSNLFGLCPFHGEKTPSFSVSPDRQIYHCFGCGKGGGVISFIMDIENLDFPGAVEFLAKRANMPLPEGSNDRESKKRSRMYALNKDAARFFYETLSTPVGADARAYILKRKISPATAKNFGLGAAPNTWNSLLNAMEAKGYTRQEMFEAGLVRHKENGGFYDTFRNRLMFPVIDVRGNVIGFSGRILDDGEPKYMNSPETLVFNKSRNLFALNLAKKSKSGYIILSEGNIDVVSLHQAGFDSAVASLGTSLTPEQARLISRYTNQVIIAYDNDGAGIKASQRAIGILEKLDIKVKVLRLNGAKDPDEFIKAKGADAFRNLLEASENQVDYRLNSIKAKYDLNADDQKVAFLKDASDLVAQLPNQVERQVYSMRVAQLVSVPPDVVAQEVERRRKSMQSGAKKAQEKQLPKIETLISQGRKRSYSDPGSAAAEEGIIRLLYLDPSLKNEAVLPKPEDFSSPELSHIYSVLLSKIDSGCTISPSAFVQELSQDEMSLLVQLQDKPERLDRSQQSLRDYIRKIIDSRDTRSSSLDLNQLANKYKQTKGYEG